MTYVFYETGNNGFFTRISHLFSNLFVWYVFVNLFNEVLQKDGNNERFRGSQGPNQYTNDTPGLPD
jgi:hypothetical protein